MNKEKTYKFKDKEYKERRKSFKPYRIQAIMYIKKYDEFESLQFPSIQKLQSEIQKELFTNKKVNNTANAGDAEKLNNAVSGALKDSSELLLKTKKLSTEKAMARELFLLSDDNAKKLCEIMLEDSDNIKHDVEIEDYEDYLRFIYGLWDDFFLMKKN